MLALMVGGGERRGADLVNEGSQEGKCHERGRRGRAASESLDPGKIPIFRKALEAEKSCP